MTKAVVGQDTNLFFDVFPEQRICLDVESARLLRVRVGQRLRRPLHPLLVGLVRLLAVLVLGPESHVIVDDHAGRLRELLRPRFRLFSVVPDLVHPGLHRVRDAATRSPRSSETGWNKELGLDLSCGQATLTQKICLFYIRSDGFLQTSGEIYS